MKTGKQVWENQLLTVEKGNKGYTGAPLIVKDKVIIGADGGEYRDAAGRSSLSTPTPARSSGSSTRSAATSALGPAGRTTAAVP